MAKSVMKNRSRIHKEKIAERAQLISVALDEGKTTKTAIGEMTGLKLWEINEVFEKNKEVHAKFCMYRRTLVDTASDNLEDILKNPEHPQNFQATKYVLQTYKNDLDSTLEKQDKDNPEVAIIGGSASADIQIIFSKPAPKETE